MVTRPTTGKNREVDNRIFQSILPSLKQIYYQYPFIDGEFLRARYKLPIESTSKFPGPRSISYVNPGVKINHITNTDQFYISIEL